MRALEGITVVTLEHAVAAPLCTRHMADHGARVIKVERPGTGDFARGYDTRVRGMSSHFVWTNRSKESVTLNLKSDGGQEVLRRLLGQADVLVQNLAPGAAQRMGLGYADLQEAHPRLIVCNISGYGPDGSDAARKAYDLLIQAEAGFLSVTGEGERMAKAGISVADIAAGMYAYSSILAALIARGRTGVGAQIDISMLEALAEWMGYPMYYAFDGAAPPARAGAAHATIFPYGPFATGDGGQVMLGLQNEREWRRFCSDVLSRPELTEDPRFATNAARAGHQDALRDIIETGFAEMTAGDVVRMLEAAGIATARINDMAGLWAHPQLEARARWTEVGSPAGRVPALLPPGLTEARMDPIPALGADTETVLQELGYNAAEIATLRDRDAI
ncbi:CaiB/BaiF CoA-transferase family protein [Aestuariicoccus sp. MJ-SS9]|uniref:CaiB/BaiF CoA transferase family protein n=1 Tax=Aestuariicoccus sp. MJ-SS9 TaxID=3079855 RepID=UPI00291276B1|nr:CaiB/BaiF CoA-transferase family protein [Aestuariicoccus sp. MJ-SS9]MDU8910805.1 CaiB/BaiF CoA-transferase family protein [Aestuariicoccus sp. MJ-SS9]